MKERKIEIMPEALELLNKKYVKKVGDIYEVLKPVNYGIKLYAESQESWERHGRKYTRKGLVNLIESDKECGFILSKDIILDILSYNRGCFEKKKNYYLRINTQELRSLRDEPIGED